MNEMIDIKKLSPAHHQALVCMFFAKLPKTDPRYKRRTEYFTLFEKKFNKKISTYKHAKDTFDAYFDTNDRIGWQDKSLASMWKECQEVYDLYKDTNIDILATATKEIFNLYSVSKSDYMALRLTDPVSVHSLLNGVCNLTVDRITDLGENLNTGRILFIALGGDKGKAEVDWETGFFAIGHVTKGPYDVGYEKNKRGTDYFKFDLIVDVFLDRPISRSGFINYPSTYDAAYIGLELHRDRSQANSMLENDQAVAIIRATIDMMPHLKESFEKVFPKEFMERVLGSTKVLVETPVNYGQDLKEAVDEKFEDSMSEERDVVSTASETINQQYEYDEYNPGDKKYKRNLIVHGAPGTGKSFWVEELRKDLLAEKGEYTRVTFHPEYSYSGFVGTYKPVPVGNDSTQGISYEYVPGPFMQILVKALQNPNKPYLLIIEEINRSNTAAVFGDVFQLLDRDNTGKSMYPINVSPDMKAYLKKETGIDFSEIRIPSNMFIWATMNSADQGVFPMDTAFKRRWSFSYIGLDDSESEMEKYDVKLGNETVNWNKLRKALNDRLTDLGINEDKLFGPFFISEADMKNQEEFSDIFKDKVISYLFEDAARGKRQKLFTTSKMRYSEVCRDFDNRGIGIFNFEGMSVDFAPVNTVTGSDNE